MPLFAEKQVILDLTHHSLNDDIGLLILKTFAHLLLQHLPTNNPKVISTLTLRNTKDQLLWKSLINQD